MFTIPSLITGVAGVYFAVVYGKDAYGGFRDVIDTWGEARDFGVNVGLSFAGLMAVVTAAHSLWG